MLKILTVSAKQRCTGFFCMDERFFNHLGPFYETTPPITNQEKITERSEILPQVINNDVHWGPTEVCNINLVFKLHFSDMKVNPHFT